ncbi:4-hydroxy-3-methylbut-2-enyl diphosphate reductase [Caulobacter sp. D4A]|uniref:4-hydroxy-3-methylbut-2-enyl diphosphate reductase n=1 Tax=unclassified Caulobacter TaxID=2648921 RepID=UPI000D7373D4|nr:MULTISPECIES: 4-hydroxy-3-methylbut-2-enyl diphosphate reductase [unclassified Caulobacter]PXA86256.1 4-hydroxy-3-methylbut-2-enyl diphosphate reductase [Caulobacter sp. D4A]PXA86502.1 4-hydroxy-3-methylbut-2-enyl diphosphate reductase [Caulobacter sp. D5]
MSTAAPPRPKLRLFLASPRGFCAGVDRAIQIVERAIEKFGAPVYVRHEIVHNRHVVDRLKALGAIFIEELDEAPDDRPVVFSAHGVPKSVPAEAKSRQMIYLDATCPLVSKVHVEAQKHFDNGREIVLIGHAGHPEVVGTMGQLPEGTVTLIEDIDDARTWQPQDASNVAFLTQTTLSVDDTADIVAMLKQRFPTIAAPHKEDICYATTNRQDAVKMLAEASDLILVVGSRNSSNSVRLKEVGLKAGAKAAYLIDDASGLEWKWFEGVQSVGLTAGASAPEDLVQGVIDAISGHFDLEIEELVEARETVTFKLPRLLTTA